MGEELLQPAAFLPGFDLHLGGDTEMAGRAALAVDACPGLAEPGQSTSFPTARTPSRSPSTVNAG